MNKIKILSSEIINQIAAGEIIEKPASIIKELVENSIDAGSTNINIFIKNAGKTKIIIEDNGHGIGKDDLLLAIQRHATSKLPNSNLFNIESYGFRGEALPSIAAISEMQIESKVAVETNSSRSRDGNTSQQYNPNDISIKTCNSDRHNDTQGINVNKNHLGTEVSKQVFILNENSKTGTNHLISTFNNIVNKNSCYGIKISFSQVGDIYTVHSPKIFNYQMKKNNHVKNIIPNNSSFTYTPTNEIVRCNTAHNELISTNSSGTRIVITNLFGNQPVRLKFLKSDNVELANCLSVIDNFALVFPNITFNVRDDKKILCSFPCSSKMQRISQIIGEEIISRAIYINEENENIKLTGYLCHPVDSKYTITCQKIFINNRAVKDKMVSSAIKTAYKDLIPAGRYAMCVLFIQIKPFFIDINVSPTKSEIRFRDNQYVQSTLTKFMLNNITKFDQMALNPDIHLNISNQHKNSKDGAHAYEHREDKSCTYERRVDGNLANEQSECKTRAYEQRDGDTCAYERSEDAPWKHKTNIYRSALNQRLSNACHSYIRNKQTLLNIEHHMQNCQYDKQLLEQHTQNYQADKQQYINSDHHLLIKQDLPTTIQERLNNDSTLDSQTTNISQNISQQNVYTIMNNKQVLPQRQTESVTNNHGADYVNTTNFSKDTEISDVPSCKQTGNLSNIIEEKSITNIIDIHSIGNTNDTSNDHIHDELDEWIPIGQLKNTYIICKTNKDLIIIDQHAVHEKITMEKLKLEISEKNKQYVIPIQLNINKQQILILNEIINQLISCGFEINIGNNNIEILSIPQILSIETAKRFLYDLLDSEEIIREHTTIDTIRLKIANIACHNSIRAGRQLSLDEMQAIINEMKNTFSIHQCNHHRPSFIKISGKILDNIFQRT